MVAGSFMARRKSAAFSPGGPGGLIEPYLNQVDFKWPNARSDFISASNIFKVSGLFLQLWPRISANGTLITFTGPWTAPFG
jgi:hypothetical protein